MKKLLYICSLCIVLSACHKDDLFYAGDGDTATLKLKIEAQNNIEISRAVSSDEQEKFIDNVYVFIFNEDGTIAARMVQDVNNNQTTTLTMTDVASGAKNIVVVANFNNTIVDLTQADLDAIETKANLASLTSTISGNFIERGANFLMSGTSDVTLTSGKATSATIALDRVDAKIRFYITAKPNPDPENKIESLRFTPLDWRVVSLPSSVAVIESAESGLIKYEGNYFESKWNNFEVTESEDINTFAFYSMENKVPALKEIPTLGEYNERYALREKQLKAGNSDGTVTNGAFEYADQRATYVEIRGNVFYKPNNTLETSADVKYIIHLGAINKDVNDYNSLRNRSYTYNVNVESVESILVEVDNDEERRPGAEGDVVLAEVIKELDSPNHIMSLQFHQSQIDELLTWNVSTPFSNGAARENPADYKWIHFAIAKKNGSFYTDTFTPYKGDASVYTDDEFSDITTYTHPLDRYMADIALGQDKMLDIKQFTEILKECKRRHFAGDKINTIFDTSDNIHFTTYIKEFYYDVNPTNPSETYKDGLWKKFVNQKKRVINILSDLTYSDDKQSTKSNALYSIRQASIQTMYNKISTDIFSAWGLQSIQDKTLTTYEQSESKSNYTPKYNDLTNGRKNSILMWDIDKGKQWTNYINQDTWVMESNYTESAKYKCLMLNRDSDGDGTIDENEVQWYLSSINQLTDMWIGENSYDNNSRLYMEPTWIIKQQWFASSTVISRSLTTDKILDSKDRWKDNPQILWSAEGSSIGALSAATDSGEKLMATVYYRCVRNLGLSKDAPAQTMPDDFAEYNEVTRILSLDRLDEKSIRGYSTDKDLSAHHERSAENKPWTSFEVAQTTSGSEFSWHEIQTKSNPTTAEADRICKDHWHVPNQRELALIHSRAPKTIWSSLNHHFTRTHFSFAKTVGEYNTRPGFSVTTDGQTFTLLNNADGSLGSSQEKGGVRCVRDVIK